MFTMIVGMVARALHFLAYKSNDDDGMWTVFWLTELNKNAFLVPFDNHIVRMCTYIVEEEDIVC